MSNKLRYLIGIVLFLSLMPVRSMSQTTDDQTVGAAKVENTQTKHVVKKRAASSTKQAVSKDYHATTRATGKAWAGTKRATASGYHATARATAKGYHATARATKKAWTGTKRTTSKAYHKVIPSKTNKDKVNNQ